MRDGSSDRIDVKNDGRVILYKRDDVKNPKWQARLKIPGSTGYKIVSTKTADQREAERYALDLYEELYFKIKQGGSLKTPTFKYVFDEWRNKASAYSSTRLGGSWTTTIERIESYALEYFGHRQIDSIDRGDFEDFWEWRKRNYKRTAPTPNTLRRERTCLLPVFRYALDRKFITSIPDIPVVKELKRRRPTFTLNEYRKFTRTMREWVKDAVGTAAWKNRFIAQQYFLILANTGMRIGELRGLRWGDLRTVDTEDGKRLIGSVTGKTGQREVVFQEGAEDYVKRLYDLRIEEKTHAPLNNDYVISLGDGKPVNSFKNSFLSLMHFAGIPIEKDGMNRTIYSFRHFYATQRLSNNTSPFLLAKQMGTSVEMLEKFYGQTVTSALAAEISRDNRRRSKGLNERSYPFE
jgi:integrase